MPARISDRKALAANARKPIYTPKAPSNSSANGQAAPKATTRKVKHPATEQDEILKGPGFMTWLENIRKHATEGSDAMTIASLTISTGIRKSSKVPFSLDRLMVARRMRRGINHLAALELETARMASAIANDYKRFFGDPDSPKTQKRDEFVP